MKNVGFAQSLYAQSSTQKEPLGMLRIEPDGRKFRYAKAGAAALSAGYMGITVGVQAYHISRPVAAAVAIGDTEVQVTVGATAVTTDQYKDGYLQVLDGTGQGHTYGIDTNTSCASSGTTIVTLKHPVIVALVTASTSEVSLIPNPWNGVTESAVEESGAAGIPLRAIDIGYYYWCQTGGLACVLGSDTAAMGVMMSLDGGAGAVAAATDYVKNFVGVTMLTAQVSGEFAPIFLTID